MTIFKPEFHPPPILQAPDLVIFPTDANYYLSDHEAVMKSRKELRLWSQSEWPADHFTPEENREDLLLHVADNNAHTAYGYMIYSADRQTCYGSLYVNPLNHIGDHYRLTAEELANLQKFDARLDYWTVTGVTDLEKRTTTLLREWFRHTWKLKVLFACRPEMHERRATFNNLGLVLAGELQGKDGKSALLLFREP